MSEPTISSITVSGKFDKMGESLKALRDFAAQSAELAGLPKSRVEGLRMAVDEYATNIIGYGYRDAGLSGNIDAEASIDDECLIFSLYDNATPFDPTAHADPTNLDEDLENRPIGGLGIMLAKQSVDEWRYEQVGNQNRNHFILKRG